MNSEWPFWRSDLRRCHQAQRNPAKPVADPADDQYEGRNPAVSLSVVKAWPTLTFLDIDTIILIL